MKNISPSSPKKAFLTRSHRKVLALLAILVLFLLNAAWNLPSYSVPSQLDRVEATHTLAPTYSNLVNTPSLAEMQSNHSMTNGIAVMGGIILLVIIAGTIIVLRRNLKEQ